VRVVTRDAAVGTGAAAWWSMASQLAAQDYLARLHNAATTTAAATASTLTTPSALTQRPLSSAAAPAVADTLLASYTQAMNAVAGVAAHATKSGSSSPFVSLF